MTQVGHAGQGTSPTQGEGLRFTLQQYRDDRVEANIRRLMVERTTADTDYAVPDSLPAESPKRSAVFRAQTLPSAFEYAYYNMPETTAQAIVAGRLIGRDMADPGIHSDGPRVADIIDQPPRHATLAPLRRPRSSREVLLSRDRAMATDDYVTPLPRPYVPRAAVDAEGEPHQHFRKRQGGKTLRRQLGSERPTLVQASLDLKSKLGSARMGLTEVQEVADYFRSLDQTDPNLDWDGVYETLADIGLNWQPDELVMKKTNIHFAVFAFKDCPNGRIANLANKLQRDWRREIRLAEGRQPTTNNDEEDPFVDDGAKGRGQTIPCELWGNIIRRRLTAAQDYNHSTAEELRVAEQRVRGEVQRLRVERTDEEMRCHLQSRPRASPRVSPDDNVNGDSEAGDGGADRPITIDDDDNVMPTGNQNFEIFESNPSPERPQQSQNNNVLRAQPRPEDIPVESIEGEQPTGLCHECPVFQGTYHHICAPDNPGCPALIPTEPIGGRTPGSNGPSQGPQGPQTGPGGRTSPSYGPSLSPQGPQAALARLIGHARAYGISTEDISPDHLRNFTGGDVNLGRQGADDGPHNNVHPPITDPRGTENLPDPFATSDPRRGLGIRRFGGVLGEGNTDVSPMKSRMSKSMRGSSPTVAVSEHGSPTSSQRREVQAQSPRPTHADYATSTHAQLLEECRRRDNSPASGKRTTKDELIDLLQSLDAAGNRGNGAPSGFNTGVVKTTENRGSNRNGNQETTLNNNLFSSFVPESQQAAQWPPPSSASRSRSSGRGGSKRPSPSAGNSDEPLGKRLRSKSGLHKPATAL